jgi:branched-chain amino acid transport system ATP-binding protein
VNNGELLEVQDLHAYYGPAHVLHGLHFTVGEQPVSIIGRNGMGKTTMCHAIMGIHPPTTVSGSIRFGGLELLGKASYKVSRAGIALVPQGRRLFGSLTVEEHLRIVVGRRRSGAWNADRIYELFPRLAERRRNDATQLSGGEQQMLAIGRALMTNPRLLILDEATEGLAPAIRDEIWRCLQNLRGSGQSILVIDKNVDALIRIADRHYIIERGCVVWTGTSQQLADAPEIQHRYLGV